MWLRDFRVTAKTVMVDAGVPSETTKAILGHKPTVADGYYKLTDEAMRRALDTLTLKEPTPAAVYAAVQHRSESSERQHETRNSA